VNGFMQCVVESGQPIIKANKVEIIQVNLGFLCNQQCAHCHLNASPDRSEVMNWETMGAVLSAAEHLHCNLIDITGGAPEMNPNFKKFVTGARESGFNVQVRSNLSILTEPEHTDLPEFFKTNGVSLVGSMPCYLEENVRAQRGPAVYEKCIEAIRTLNAIGYGVDQDLQLNLVYNPGGAFLPPSQKSLEEDYRRELAEKWDIHFTNLLTIANVPIGRFKSELQKQGTEAEYIRILRSAFNPNVLNNLMCRHQISVGYDGTVYDCDFNLALHLPVKNSERPNIKDVDFNTLRGREIVTGDHCLACSAGDGSSCAGTLV
jgi:radical SAM/Cys-rich protein